MFQQTASLWRRLTCRSQPKREVGLLEDERRVWVRYPSCLETELKSDCRRGRTLSLCAQIHDVSAGGIKLLVEQEFEPGTLLTVTLPGGNQSSMVSPGLRGPLPVSGLRPVIRSAVVSRPHSMSDSCVRLEWTRISPRGGQSRPRTVFLVTCGHSGSYRPISKLLPRRRGLSTFPHTGMAVQLDRNLPTGTLISAELSRDQRALNP